MAFVNPARETGLSSRYLKVADLRRLRHVTFAARRVVEGRATGLHRSRQRGQSIEFKDYRQYMPGDPPTDVDWKVYGRSDRLFIKLYEHESDMSVHLLVDGSASMAYGGLPGGPGATGPTKYDQACSLAASLAFLVTRQRDRVAFTCARGGRVESYPPFSTLPRLAGLLKLMERIEPAGRADLAGAVDHVARAARRRGLLVLLSDLLDEDEAILQALSVYASRGNEVIVFQVLHQDELELPASGRGLFVDSESHEKMRVDLDDLRAAYASRLRAFLEGWSGHCARRGIDYNLVSTAADAHRALERYLFRRAART